MAAFVFSASAIVKRYVLEIGTVWVRALTDPAAAHQYNCLEISPALLLESERLAELHAIRGNDAVQLAVTAALYRARTQPGLGDLTFVSADAELNDAARAEGLAVDDPNGHP